MESLSAECTPLKRQYDSCFNAWFQGYLQPALAVSTSPVPAPSQNLLPVKEHAMSLEQIETEQTTPVVIPNPQRITTSWSGAFTTRPRLGQENVAQSQVSDDPMGRDSSSTADGPGSDSHDQLRGLDATGRTRAQQQAQEYDKRCGKVWAEYKTCLTKAISENPSLLALLDQARDEHPLLSLSGLQGTAWDPKSVMEE